MGGKTAKKEPVRQTLARPFRESPGSIGKVAPFRSSRGQGNVGGAVNTRSTSLRTKELLPKIAHLVRPSFQAQSRFLVLGLRRRPADGHAGRGNDAPKPERPAHDQDSPGLSLQRTGQSGLGLRRFVQAHPQPSLRTCFPITLTDKSHCKIDVNTPLAYWYASAIDWIGKLLHCGMACW